MAGPVLVAVDINDAADARHLIAKAAAQAALEDLALHVVSVIPDSGMAIVSSYLGPDHEHQVLEQAGKTLVAITAEAAPELLSSQIHMLRGTIYNEILKLAEKLEASLIVVGAHRPELMDYLIGPNSARVARHAPQSVMIVRR